MVGAERKVRYVKFVRGVNPNYGQIFIGRRDGSEFPATNNFNDPFPADVEKIRDSAISLATQRPDGVQVAFAQRDEGLIERVLEEKKARVQATSSAALSDPLKS